MKLRFRKDIKDTIVICMLCNWHSDASTYEDSFLETERHTERAHPRVREYLQENVELRAELDKFHECGFKCMAHTRQIYHKEGE